jgi:Ca2+-binding RTX toxin-like protein
MTTLNYAYNDGTYNATLGSADLAALQGALQQAEADPTTLGTGSVIYNTLLGIFVDPGLGTTGTVDPNVLAWLQGAVGVNQDTSSPGMFIRAYTSAIYLDRYGTQQPTDAQLNFSSNEIAINLAKSVISNGGLLPTIEGLGAIDAGFGAAANLFNQASPDPSSGVYSPWAGTLLFPFLGDSSFYQNWLLNMDTVQGAVTNPNTNLPTSETFKSIGGTYDLVASLEAFSQTTDSNPFSTVLSGLGKFVSDPASFISISLQLSAETQSFFQSVYGLTSNQVPGIGLGTPFAPFGGPVYQAGAIGDDTALIVDNNGNGVFSVVNAGPGNDRIVVFEAAGLIDGGDGVNTADFTNLVGQSPLTFTLQSPDSPYFDYRVQVTPEFVRHPNLGDGSVFLYNIQNIFGDSAASSLHLTAFAQTFWSGLGQNLALNLGAGAANEVDIDGSATAGANFFSIAQGPSGGDVIVSAVSNDSAGTPAAYGVDVTNSGKIVVTGGSGDVLNLNNGLSSNLSALQVIDTSSSAALSETIVKDGDGSLSFTDETGHVFETFSGPADLNNGTIRINGNEIDTYAGGQIQNSTQSVDLGNGVTGALDKTYGPGYSFATLDVPGTGQSPSFTFPTGVSDNGTVVGYYDVPFASAFDTPYRTQITEAFTEQNGTFSLPDILSSSAVPQAQVWYDDYYTFMGGINNTGTVVGDFISYTDFVAANPSQQAFVQTNGTYYFFHDPNDVPSIDPFGGGELYHSYAAGINNAGTIVGYYFTNDLSGEVQSGTAIGFIDNGGQFTDVIAPNDFGGGTFLVGINDAGVIVGDYGHNVGLQGFDVPATAFGFVYDHGTFTNIVDPDAPNGTDPYYSGITGVTGINDSNEIVGYYTDPNTGDHGFIDINGTFTTIDDPNARYASAPGAALGNEGRYGTVITGVNNNGEVVGYYYDSNGQVQGFAADPDNAQARLASSTLEINSSGTVDLRQVASSSQAPQAVDLAAGDNTVYVGSASETISGGRDDTYYVDSTTMGATINGGTGTNVLDVIGGGATVMGSNITGVSSVVLAAAPVGQTQPAFNFSANTTTGLVITDDSSSNDTVNAGSGADIIYGGSGNDSLSGGLGSDVFYAGSGSNYLQGNGGNDVYNLQIGGSNTDTINNFHTDNGESVLNLNTASTNIVASQSGNDLVLTFGTDPVIVQNYFAGTNYQLASINFADGVSWNTAAVFDKIAAPANPVWEDVSDIGTFAHDGKNFTLDLGSIAQNGVPTSVDLGVLNSATAPADLLSGSFGISSDDEFCNFGFGAFSGLGAGQSDTAPNVTLNTTVAGSFSDTITLTPADSNLEGMVTALSQEILTITGTVVHQRIQQGGDGDGIVLNDDNSVTDDTLIAGNGKDDIIYARETSGSNVLTSGNGDNDTLDASSSSGSNSLTAGIGNNDVLDVSNSSGNNVLTGSDGNYDILTAKSATGNNAIIAGNGIDDVLYGGSGNDSFVGGNGGDTFYLGTGSSTSQGSIGVITVQAGSRDDVVVVNAYTITAGSSLDGGAGNNTLEAGAFYDELDISQASVHNFQTVDASWVTLTADQFGQFNTFVGSNELVILGATAGTYSMEGKTAVGTLTMIATASGDTTLIGNDSDGVVLEAGGSGNDLLTAGNGNGDVIYGGGGNDTLTLGNGNNDAINAFGTGNNTITLGNGANDAVYFGFGVDTVIGGNGGDTFNAESSLAAGSQIAGGTGNDTLIANGDISQATISGIETLQTEGATLTAEQFAGFTTIDTNGFAQLTITTGGIVSLPDKIIIGNIELQTTSPTDTTLIANDADNLSLSAQDSTGNDTLIGGNGYDQSLVAGSGNDTLIAGNGQDQILTTGTGIDTLIGGTGNDTFDIVGLAATGTTIEGGSGANTLLVNGDITGLAYSNVQTLEVVSATLTASELDGFSTVMGNFDTLFPPLINAATPGTYSLVGKSTDLIDMQALSAGGTTLIGNDADSEALTASSSGNDTLMGGNGNNDFLIARGTSGNDTLIAGNGTNDTLGAKLSTGNDTLIGGAGGDVFNGGLGTDKMYGGEGNDVFNAGTGNDYMQGGNGDNTYNFASASSTGSYTINDFHTDSGQSILEFGPGVTATEVVASQSGNDLVLTIGSDPITVQNFFSGSSYQLSGVQFADGVDWSTQQIETIVGNPPGGSPPPIGAAPPHIANTATPLPTGLDASLESTPANAAAGGSVIQMVAQPTGTAQIGSSGPPVLFSQSGDAFVFANSNTSIQTPASELLVSDQDSLHSAFSQAAEITANVSPLLIAEQVGGSEAIGALHLPVMFSNSPPEGFHLV